MGGTESHGNSFLSLTMFLSSDECMDSKNSSF